LHCFQAASELLVAAEEEVAGKMALAERAVAVEVEAGQAVADSAKALEKAEMLAEDIAAVQRNAASIAAQKTVQLANQLAEAAASLASAGFGDDDDSPSPPLFPLTATKNLLLGQGEASL